MLNDRCICSQCAGLSWSCSNLCDPTDNGFGVEQFICCNLLAPCCIRKHSIMLFIWCNVTLTWTGLNWLAWPFQTTLQGQVLKCRITSYYEEKAIHVFLLVRLLWYWAGICYMLIYSRTVIMTLNPHFCRNLAFQRHVVLNVWSAVKQPVSV